MRNTTRFVLIALAATPTALRAYSGGPPDAHAGDPPLFQTCTACHSSFPLNSGNGGLFLLGVPTAYVPDSTYTISVRLTDPGQRRWGFELTVLREIDDLRGGALLELDPGTTQISSGSGEQQDYAKQTLAGTFPNATQAQWDLLWTAPQAGVGATRFYVTGNAANNSNTPIFDYIYSLERLVEESVPAEVSPDGSFSRPHKLRIEPNPAVADVTLDWDRSLAIPRSLSIFDVSGRRVRYVPIGAEVQGHHHWDTRDAFGSRLPGGTYYLILETTDGPFRGRVVVSR